jgi:hypothetical protein
VTQVKSEPRHGKRDEIAFAAGVLGEAKTRSEEIGRTQRAAFADIMRMLEALALHGIKIDPAQITFDDPVDQAAWRCYIMPSNLRSPLEPPMMETEAEILRAVQ